MIHTELRRQRRKWRWWVRRHRWREARVGLCLELSVGFRLRKAQAEECRGDGWNAIEKPRERKRLNFAEVGATETGDIANQTETEMVIEETEAAADDGFRCSRPSKPDTRGHVVLLLKS